MFTLEVLNFETSILPMIQDHLFFLSLNHLQFFHQMIGGGFTFWFGGKKLVYQAQILF